MREMWPAKHNRKRLLSKKENGWQSYMAVDIEMGRMSEHASCTAKGIAHLVAQTIFDPHLNEKVSSYIDGRIFRANKKEVDMYWDLPRASALGHTHIAEWMYLHKWWSKEEKIQTLENAAKMGHFQLLKWLHNRKCEGFCGAVADASASQGHLGILEWLQKEARQKCSSKAICTSSSVGHLPTLEWVVQQYREEGSEILHHMGREAAKVAALNGHLQVVKYLEREAAPFFQHGEVLTAAVEEGRLSIAEWVASANNLQKDKRRHLQETWRQRCVKKAALRGHFHVVEWLLESKHFTSLKFDPNMPLINAAAVGGSLALCEWLHARGHSRCSAAALSAAASRGDLPLCEWVHARLSAGAAGAPPPEDPFLLDEAAGSGCLELARWLRRRGHGASARAMDMAAAGGHLRLVEWLHAEGFACTGLAAAAAALDGHLEVLEWLRAHRAEGPDLSTLQLAAAGGHLRVVEWLHTHGAEWLQRAAAAGGGGLADARRFFPAEAPRGLLRLVLARDALRHAAARGRFAAAAWLWDRMPPPGLDAEGHAAALAAARRGGHRRLARWLRLRGADLRVRRDWFEWASYLFYLLFAAAGCWALAAAQRRGGAPPAAPPPPWPGGGGRGWRAGAVLVAAVAAAGALPFALVWAVACGLVRRWVLPRLLARFA